MAREKAEKAAMQESMATNVVIWFPLMFIAFMMMFGGAIVKNRTMSPVKRLWLELLQQFSRGKAPTRSLIRNTTE